MLGKIGYGAIFVIGVPALLVAWARGTADVVNLRPLHAPLVGTSLALAGVVLIGLGMWALRAFGGGLPMNAYPPPRFVERGVYAVLPHPIYVGFVAAVLGVSLFAGSASGLWLVTPLAALGCAALVLGYEGHDLVARFGSARPRTALRLPEDTAERPTFLDRVSVDVLVIVPWIAVYEGIVWLGVPHDAVSTFLSFEKGWPVLPWSEVVYASTYVGVFLATACAPTKASLRRLALRGLYAMVLVFPLYLALPFVAPPRPFTPDSALGQLLAMERAADSPVCAFPSFHVIWAIFAAAALADAWPRARGVLYAWAVAVGASCVATGMHSLVDVVWGSLAAFAVLRAGSVWSWTRRRAEAVANSWREWNLGPVRIINHGGYAAAGTALGAAIVGALAGRGSAPAVLVLVLLALVCSALWAQVVEGSSQLLRPYGFYGGLLGVIVGCLLAPAVSGGSTWTLLAAASVSGPFVQSLGRLRCLVQGCCHGSPAPPEIGIRYTHPRSRVTRVPDLSGAPIHPTPLYSILWNALVALVMGRLWSMHAELSLIGGLYLVLSGLGRFVEESYRGERQTPRVAKLPVYQWIAVGTVFLGIVVTIAFRGGPAPAPELTWPVLGVAILSGLLAGAALGLDFPRSERRFSRLA